MVLPSILNFFKAVIFLILSWVLVHFFAAFGVFLAFAYPIWGFIAPQRLPCIFCLMKSNKQSCSFCNKGSFELQEEQPHPITFRSLFFNMLFIIVVSGFCVGLVFLEGRILFSLGFPPTPKTVSFIIPSKGQYRLEEIFPMKIEIAGIKTPINTIQADIGFDPARLEVVEIATEDSFANIFIQKEINNNVGYARLTGGLPNPGFFATHGVFGTIYFKSLNPGLTQVEFLPSSLILANDGQGTNVLKDLVKASYLILPEKISKSEESLQESLLRPIVLGESTDETQMRFYEEGQILGQKTVREAILKDIHLHDKIISFFSNVIEIVDRLILEFWGQCFVNFCGLKK